jgi:hypothetical protein
MNRLSDEILNKYIDGELEPEKLKEVKAILSESAPDRENLKALLKVHNNLKEINEFKVSANFTSAVMNKIALKFKPRKADKYFIVSISSFFILLSLVIIGIVISFIINMPSQSNSTSQVIGYLISSLENFSLFIKKIFGGPGLSIFGSVISLGILITAYFFFDSHKHIKEIQNKL